MKNIPGLYAAKIGIYSIARMAFLAGLGSAGELTPLFDQPHTTHTNTPIRKQK